MKMKEIRKLYKEVRDLDNRIKSKEESIDYTEIKQKKIFEFVEKFGNRLKYLFFPRGLYGLMSNYAYFESAKDELQNDIYELKPKRNNLVQKLKDNNLPVNGEVASADGIVETIYAMKKVK